MSRTVPPTTTGWPAMQIGTATYEGRHRAGDPYRILNHRPVATPLGDEHEPRHAAPDTSDVDRKAGQR